LDLGRLEGGDAADEGGSEKGRHCSDACAGMPRDARDARDRAPRSTVAIDVRIQRACKPVIARTRRR